MSPKSKKNLIKIIDLCKSMSQDKIITICFKGKLWCYFDLKKIQLSQNGEGFICENQYVCFRDIKRYLVQGYAWQK